MTIPSPSLIRALRIAAFKLQNSPHYQWGHMGSCNCGFLAQEITHLDREEIHRRAMTGSGDWSEQLRDYCPSSGLAMDELISELVGFGFDRDDLTHLERLSDPLVLSTLPENTDALSFNNKENAVIYMRGWADLLEERLLLTASKNEVENKDVEMLEQVA
jgi:hypothetical protein